MLTVEKRIISRNFTRAGAGRKIEYIVIHYFGSLARHGGGGGELLRRSR